MCTFTSATRVKKHILPTPFFSLLFVSGTQAEVEMADHASVVSHPRVSNPPIKVHYFYLSMKNES